jgi:hypothetical protein
VDKIRKKVENHKSLEEIMSSPRKTTRKRKREKEEREREERRREKGET